VQARSKLVENFFLSEKQANSVLDMPLKKLTNLEKKGDLIRWSIVDIQNSIDSFGTKKHKNKAVLAN